MMYGAFSLPRDVISRLWSVIVALPRHILYYFSSRVTVTDRTNIISESTVSIIVKVCYCRSKRKLTLRKLAYSNILRILPQREKK